MILYYIAIIVTIGSIPFTLLAISSTNNPLLQKVKCNAKSVNGDHEEVGRLVRKWKMLKWYSKLVPILWICRLESWLSSHSHAMGQT
ncbi:DUF1772 domain-containing protein [Aspergillus alliaceus]|uniref:DUF1772 domain-containing protein n=1 Tax=Petromyces alliaceus TaxID=209559 RepID=UPI0012A4DA45|nr:uncharacterized protein BDW43DRAFT_257552 [Aspergillus alliaceus]KAB8239308.1 hypothetical protein BDW43DRAFT_257552 [Aspergillus alliaceus]